MSYSLICYVLACVCFILAALGVPKYSWRDFGIAFLILGYFIVK